MRPTLPTSVGRVPYRATRLQRRLINQKQVLPRERWNVVKGDTVQILAGKSRGMQGVVTKVKLGENRLFVSGVNLHKRHVSPSPRLEAGGIVSREAPVHYSNVALLDPEDGRPTRVSIGYDDATGRRVRVSRRSGQVIPKPERKEIAMKQDGPRDTPAELAQVRTFDGKVEGWQVLEQSKAGLAAALEAEK